jgi:hypothetical protein
MHSSTDQFLAPRPSAMIPPVLNMISIHTQRVGELLNKPSTNNEIEKILNVQPASPGLLNKLENF